MAVSNRKSKRPRTARPLLWATLGSYIVLTTAGIALAQETPKAEKLQLSADEVVYNRDAEIVTASGAVQVHYNGYSLVAQRVDYDQKTGRVAARGHIELVEPGGNRIYAEDLDVTDNFGSGFLNSLRVETVDNTIKPFACRGP